MPTCAICDHLVKADGRFGTWRRFCSRRCAGIALSRWTAVHFNHEKRQRLGREGAAAKRESYRQALLQRLRELPRDAAILAAYKAGRHAAKMDRLRNTKDRMGSH